MRAPRPMTALLLLALLALTAGGAFVVGRRWPIARLDALIARWRPEATAAALLPWRVTDALPLTRYENGTARIGRELYFIGGFYNAATQATTRVDVLHLDTGAWRRAADLPEALTHGNAVVLGDTAIWLAGGFVGDHPGPTTASTWRYSVREDRWTAGPPLPAPRGGGAVAAIGDTIHYLGGWLPDRATDSPDHWRLLPGATTWQPRAPLPEPRGHLAAVTLEGTLYAIGGNHGHDPAPVDVASVHAYSSATDSWSAVAGLAMPRSHAEPGTMPWRGRALLAGGRNNGLAAVNLGDVVSWDPATGRGRFELALPMALLAPTAVVVGDTLVVGGGAPRGNDPTNTTVWRAGLVGTWLRFPEMPLPLGEVSAGVVGDHVFVLGEGAMPTLGFDLRTGRWTSDAWAARPMNGHHHAAEVVNGELVLLGGLGNEYVGRIVQRFDPARNGWRLGPPLPMSLGSSASAVMDGRVYVAGGISGNRTVGDAFVLDSMSGVWRRIAPMPRPRNHAASATDGRRLWVFGGRGPGSGDSNVVANGFADVQVYDPATDRWSVSDGSPTAPLPLPVARGGMGKAVFLDGEFWILGGETLNGPGANALGTYDRVDIYNPVTRAWRVGPPMRRGRHGIFPVVDDGRILIAGGGERAAHSASASVEVLRPR